VIVTIDSKKAIRSAMRARRQALSGQECRQAAKGLARCLRGLPAYRNSRRIAMYFANDNELDPSVAMSHARACDKQCYVPVLYTGRLRKLWFAPLHDDQMTVPNKLGIPEPAGSSRHWLCAMQLDLILLPLVAFDVHGNRIGMGGGYYDRTLEYLRQRVRWRRPQLVGMAYEFQRLNRIDTESWDVGLQAIVTESNIYNIN
jgi:5-formyltetrahydrofolate cyclo-ligase